MLIPQYIYFGPYQIYIALIFLLVGVFVSLFVLWLEGTKDGFDYERLFDLFFISGILSLFLSLAVIWYLAAHIYLIGLDYYFIASYITFLGTYLVINYFTKVWVWSYFRIADLTAIVFAILLASLLLSQKMLIYFSVCLFIIILAITFRRKLQSGLIYSIFLMMYAVVAFISYRSLDNLIFYLVLITISLSTFAKRKKVGTGYAQYSFRPKFHRRSKRTPVG